MTLRTDSDGPESEVSPAKRSGNGYLAAPGRFFRTAVVAYIAAGLAVLYLPFALGQKHFFHDSLSAAAIMGLFYDRVFSADSWLWSSALNGGHPLWPSFEVFPIVDPVAVVVYGVAVMFGASWMVAYQVSTILWLFLSGLGSALCAHYMSGNRWAGLLAFVLMTAGPFVLSIPAQSSGTLIPFRYFPPRATISENPRAANSTKMKIAGVTRNAKFRTPRMEPCVSTSSRIPNAPQARTSVSISHTGSTTAGGTSAAPGRDAPLRSACRPPKIL